MSISPLMDSGQSRWGKEMRIERWGQERSVPGVEEGIVRARTIWLSGTLASSFLLYVVFAKLSKHHAGKKKDGLRVGNLEFVVYS